MLQHKRQKLQKKNCPKTGASIKVKPIREISAIARIKELLQHQPRNLCLFVLGINTAYRANELLMLHISDVKYLKVGDTLEIKQSKNKKYRKATLNGAAITAIENWLNHHPQKNENNAPLFPSQRTRTSLTVEAVNRLVKKWCKEVNLIGNYGSHTLRKTWGYQQRVLNNKPVALLMIAFGHSSEQQTLNYLCIQPDEIKDLYLSMEL